MLIPRLTHMYCVHVGHLIARWPLKKAVYQRALQACVFAGALSPSITCLTYPTYAACPTCPTYPAYSLYIREHFASIAL